eukprot:g4016.t1
MLSAEYFALEHEATRQMLQIRQQEVSYMTERFNAIGTQSSLIAGLVITTLTAVDTSPVEMGHERFWVREAFFLSSALSFSCSLHCILCSTFASIYGPGLALQGQEGSVSKAYFAMVRERKHILYSFTLSLFFLVFQIISAFFILDEQKGYSTSSVSSSSIVLLSAGISAAILRRMKNRFFGKKSRPDDLFGKIDDERCENSANAASTFTVDNSRRAIIRDDAMEKPLLEGAEGRQEADGVELSNAPTPTAEPYNNLEDSPFSHGGYLTKRGSRLGLQVRRWFMLRGPIMYYWDSKEAFENFMRLPPRERAARAPRSFSLAGYEVLVKKISQRSSISDILLGENIGGQQEGRSPPRYSLVLSALDDTKKTRVYNADSRSELREWVKALVAASLIAQ